MADYGMKLSLNSNDANTSVPEEETLRSTLLTPEIRVDAVPAHLEYFSYTFGSNPTPGTTTNIKTVIHGYGYTPISIVYYRQNDPSYFTGFKILPWYYSTSNAFARVIFYTNTTQFKIDWQRASDGGFNDAIDLTGVSFDFKYYIFAQVGV